MINLKLIGLLTGALIIVGLVGTIFYYKSQVASKQATINTLSGEISTLKVETTTMKKHIVSVNNQVNQYVDELASLSQENVVMTQKLQTAKTKLAKHKLLSLRNSHHSELVLKVINKSTARLNKEWMK